MFNEIKNTVISFFKQMKELYSIYAPQEIQNTVESISGSIGNLFGQVKQFGEKLIGQAVIKAFQASNQIVELLKKLGSTLETVKAGLTTVKNAVVDLLKGAANIPNALMGFVASLFQPAEKTNVPVPSPVSVPTTVASPVPSSTNSPSTLINNARADQARTEAADRTNIARKKLRFGS